ncbi:hypothetical protein GXW82_35575 [Streptacidiphilus sp. 4-A2]|nr:hypothetical protein [Streptacidiphilus sp. 4-A2]
MPQAIEASRQAIALYRPRLGSTSLPGISSPPTSTSSTPTSRAATRQQPRTRSQSS